MVLVTDKAAKKLHEKYPGVDREYFFAITEVPQKFLCPYCPADSPTVLKSLEDITPHGYEKHAVGDSTWRTIVDKGVVKNVDAVPFTRGIKRKVLKMYCPYCWDQVCELDVFGLHLVSCQKFEDLMRDGKLELEQYDDEEGGEFNEVDERYCDEYVNQECQEESAKTELPFLSDLLAKHGLC
ncbi:hypothetical protein BDZ89DRAFT_1065248 [Hymenopellis radicata]|nr:hypothetical protein BDZ89DRAFT_1065248 [Hymenopellis radicata]